MNIRHSTFRQCGMMLLEVMIAILIFAIGVLGMVKMQAVSTANSVNSEDRATAALLANDLIAELWVAKSATAPSDYAGATTSGTWQYRVAHALNNGDGELNTGTTTPCGTTTTPITCVSITWNRQLGRNVEFASATTDPNNKATYMTQLVIQ